MTSVGTSTRTIESAVLRTAMQGSERRFRLRKLRSTALVRALQIGSLVVFLGAWEYLVRQGFANELFFSRPSAIASFIKSNWEKLVGDTGITLLATAMGFFIGSTAGVVVGLIMARFEWLDRTLQPWVSVLMSLPRIALAPLFIIWFGITLTAQVALAVSIVFFVVLVSTVAGARGVDPDLKTMARNFRASELQLFTKIIIPGSVAGIFAGLRLGVITAILGVIASEMIAASGGLGQDIIFYGQNLNSAGVFAVLAFLASIATALNGVVGLWERRLSKWQRD